MSDVYKEWYRASEIAAMTLPALPTTERGIKMAAAREG